MLLAARRLNPLQLLWLLCGVQPLPGEGRGKGWDALFSVPSQLLTPAQALQRHCSAAASNELWPLPNAGCRQMKVSELTSLQQA